MVALVAKGHPLPLPCRLILMCSLSRHGGCRRSLGRSLTRPAYVAAVSPAVSGRRLWSWAVTCRTSNDLCLRSWSNGTAGSRGKEPAVRSGQQEHRGRRRKPQCFFSRPCGAKDAARLSASARKGRVVGLVGLPSGPAKAPPAPSILDPTGARIAIAEARAAAQLVKL